MIKVIDHPTLRYDRDLADANQMDWLVLEHFEDSAGEYGSSILDESNWDAAVAEMEKLNCRCDWSKEAGFTGDWDIAQGLIIVRPESAAHWAAEELEKAYENYPVMDDEDFSRREMEAYEEAWENYGRGELLDLLSKTYGLGGDSSAIYRFLDDKCSSDELRELFEAGISSGDYYHAESDGVSINFRSFDLSRKDLARHIRNLRAAHNPRVAWRDPAQGSLFDWS